MANQLDLEEQEQLDQIKHFWNQHGNWITWLLIAVLGTLGAWNGYQLWQERQAAQAAAMYDEVDKVVKGGDPLKAERAFMDMKERFANTLHTQQAGFLVAKLNFDAGKTDSAKGILSWLAENASDKGYASIARLRLSSVLVESKSFDDALKWLAADIAPEFFSLAADRRGDIYMLQGKKSQAKSEYEAAYKSLDEQSDYRRLVAIKLGALGVDPLAVAAGKSNTAVEGIK